MVHLMALDPQLGHEVPKGTEPQHQHQLPAMMGNGAADVGALDQQQPADGSRGGEVQ